MNKKQLFLMTAAPCLLAISVFAGYQAFKKSEKISPMQGSEYTMTLDSDDVPDTLTTSYQNNVTGTVTNSVGYEIDLSFVNAKKADDKFVDLAPRGMIYNFGTKDEAVTGINGIKYTGSGVLYARTAKAGQAGGAVLNDFEVLTSGVKKSLPVSNYFEIMAGEGGAIIDELELSYSCNPEDYAFANLKGTYTGVGNDGSTYKLDVNADGTVAIASLDKQVNIALNGTGVMLNANQAKCTFVYNTYNIYYTMNVSADKHTLTYVSKSDDVGGEAAAQVAQVSFNRVYTLDNYELYDKTGQGYTDATTKYQTSGLRANYYADYYTGSGSGDIGGSGWPIMTSTDNSNLITSLKHSGSKAGLFKFSNGTSMRYISMNSLYGVQEVVGKGAKLSLWAYRAFTKQDLSAKNSANIPMKAYAYFNTPLTSSTQQTYRESFDFTVQAKDEWQHFEFNLTEGRNYFGFGFYAQQSSGSTAYVPLDDFEIYTASPYAEYVPANPVTGIAIPPSLELQGTRGKQLVPEFTPEDAGDKRVEWASNNEAVATVDENGIIHGVSAGTATITVTSKDGGFTDTCDVTVTDDFAVSGMFLGYSNFSNPLGDDFEAYILIGINSNGQVEAFVNGANAIVTDKSFNMLTGEFTLTCTGTLKVSGQTLNIGNIHGYYDPTNQKLVNVGLVGGNISGYVDDNNSIECSNANALMTNNCDADTTTLRATFARREGSTWSVNKNIVESTNMDYVGGGKSVLFPIDNASTGGRCAFTLASDISNATLRSSAKNVAFWVYNPTDTDITAKLFVYNTASYGSNVNPNSFTFKAGQWTLCASGLGGVAQVYNLQFFIGDTQNKLKTDIMFDNFMLFR